MQRSHGYRDYTYLTNVNRSDNQIFHKSPDSRLETQNYYKVII